MALLHVSGVILGDKDIVLEAVREYVRAFEFASSEIQGDCDVVIEAAEHNRSSLQHANMKKVARDNTTRHAKF